MSSRREFPDLSASVIQAVKAQYKNRDEAKAVLQQLVANVPSEREQRRYIAELADYQALGEETILRVLKEHAWDVEKAIVPLWNLLSETNSRANREKAHTILQELFQAINKETIQQVLEKHDGDVDAASQELLRYVAKTEEKKETPEEKRKRERQDVVETMAKRFPNIPREDCTKALERVNWSLQDAVHLILRKIRDGKVEAFKVQYPSLSNSEILGSIEGNDYTGDKTKENLEALVKLKAANKAPLVTAHLEVDLMQEAIKIGGQIDQFIAAQQPETLAAVALQTTMRIGNRPGALTSLDTQSNGTEPASGNAAAAAAAGAGMEFSLVSVSVSSEAVAKGEVVEVQWSHSQEATDNDWIGLYKAGADNNAYLAYQWVNRETRTSSFTMPTACGAYNFRYFHNKTYTSYGHSKEVIVGPQFSVVPVSVSPTEIKIRVEQKTGATCPNLWVGFYADGQNAPQSYLYFEWVTAGEEVTFKVPKAGSWNFKVFSDKGYDFTTSFSILVQGTDTLDLFLDTENNKARVEFDVTTVDPRQDGVWIGIFNVDQEDCRYYRRYKNISEHKGSFEVKAMQTAGTYEARLFANGTYQALCTSKTRVTVN